MLESTLHTALARELDESERTRVQLLQFSRRYPSMTMADSYAIQREWVRLQRDAGRVMIGHKIGLTSRAMQIASQVTEPDYGTLLDSMLLRDGSEVEAARFIVPRFEVEETGLGAAVLNHPGNGVAWLANKLAPHGEHLAAGEIVLGGSFTRPVACAAGDTFHADFGPLGSISVRFV